MINHFELLSQPFASTEDAVATAIEVYKDAGKYADDVRKHAKAAIEEIILETGQTEWSTPAGKIYFPKPSLSVSYDAKALDALCASSPELAAILKPHRRETERAGSMTIK